MPEPRSITPQHEYGSSVSSVRQVPIYYVDQKENKYSKLTISNVVNGLCIFLLSGVVTWAGLSIDSTNRSVEQILSRIETVENEVLDLRRKSDVRYKLTDARRDFNARDRAIDKIERRVLSLEWAVYGSGRAAPPPSVRPDTEPR